jgi:hypothetical protein
MKLPVRVKSVKWFYTELTRSQVTGCENNPHEGENMLPVLHVLCCTVGQCIRVNCLTQHTSLFTFLPSRLHVYGVDFRNLTALEWFCSYVIANYDRLDAIVNNAAQTVRRPPAYYAHLVEGEKMLTYTAGFDDDIGSSSSSSSSSNRSYNGSSSTSGSSSSGNGAGSSSSSSSCDPVRSSESTSEQDIDSAGRERVRSVLRHQQRYSSSLSAAVEAAEGTGAGAASRIEEIGARVVMQGEVKSVVLNDTDASFVTVSGQPKTRDVQMTPAISSSEMTQLILTKVSAS